MSDFLDRLAMEISEWPKLSEFPSWMPLGRIDSAAHWEKEQTTGMWLIYKRNKLGESGAPITEDEWRQRRAVLNDSHQIKGASSDALFAPITETVSFINLVKDEEAKHLLIDHLERLLDLRLHGLEQG